MKIEWKVTRLISDKAGGVVTHVFCAVVAEDGDRYCSGAPDFDIPREQSESFVPYDQLTNDIVMGWVREHYADAVAAWEAQLASALVVPDVNDERPPWEKA